MKTGRSSKTQMSQSTAMKILIYYRNQNSWGILCRKNPANTRSQAKSISRSWHCCSSNSHSSNSRTAGRLFEWNRGIKLQAWNRIKCKKKRENGIKCLDRKPEGNLLFDHQHWNHRTITTITIIRIQSPLIRLQQAMISCSLRETIIDITQISRVAQTKQTRH